MTMTNAVSHEHLSRAGQEHLLAFHDELEDHHREHLLRQISELDLDHLETLVERYAKNKPEVTLGSDIQPARYYPHDPTSPVNPYDAEHYRKAGEELIRAGKIAAFTVAGGQGTRLGFSGPKGAFPAGPVTGKPLFQLFAEGILATERRYNCTVPWYIMTSPLNDSDTRKFFEDNNFFGLKRSNVMFFQQGVLPSFHMETGKLLLADKHIIATNPDGHGGSLRALFKSGAIDDMLVRGVEHISYTQVDNPLVKMVDPLFIGLHAFAPDSSAQMSSKMVPKVAPDEKVGVFCLVDGKTTVIEYSDMPEELASQRNEDGSLRFNAGSIAIHIISVEFIRSLNTGEAEPGGFSLPLHRAEKKVAHIDHRTGERIEPDKPNAVKLEAFVFDALPLCDKSIVYETLRVEEFAPIKNATGVDSPESSARIQTEKYAGWLEKAGVKIPRKPDGSVDALIEISPLTALEPDDLKDRDDLPEQIKPGERIAL